MQQRLDEMDHRLVWRLASGALDFFTRLLFLTTPKVHKHHQHARFEDVRIDRERFGEGRFGAFIIFRSAKTFEDAVDVTGAESIVGEREVWIELNGALEMLDR